MTTNTHSESYYDYNRNDLSRPNPFDLPNPTAEGIMDIYYANFSDLDDSPFDRKCIADILEYVIKQLREHQEPGHGRFVIFCEDLWDVVDNLRKRSYSE